MKQSEYPTSVKEDREQDILTKLRTAPGDTSILLELQTYYKEQARYKDAVAILKQLLEKDLSPNTQAEVLHNLVYALYRQDYLEEAIRHAESLPGICPDYRYLGSVYRLLGVMYAERSAWQEDSESEMQDLKVAIRHLRYALELVEDRQERAAILVDLGAALSNSGELEAAKQMLEEALGIGIEDMNISALCYRRLGRILHTLGQTDRAISYYEKSISFHSEQPDNSQAMTCVDLASLYRGKDVERAEQYCQRAMQRLDQSDTKWASYVLGRIYEEMGDISLHKEEHQQAIENYRLALQPQYLPGNQADLFHKLGVALHWDGQYKKALESFRQALALELSSRSLNEEHIGALLFHMGECAYNLHDFQQATVLLEEATEKIDLLKLAEVHLSLGHSYFRLKRFNNAAEFYGKVIRETKLLSPNWRQAMKYLVWARMAR